jgi:hypothetical protein
VQPHKKKWSIHVTEFGIIGGAVSDVQPFIKEQPILVTEFGIVGGVASDLQKDKK